MCLFGFGLLSFEPEEGKDLVSAAFCVTQNANSSGILLLCISTAAAFYECMPLCKWRRKYKLHSKCGKCVMCGEWVQRDKENVYYGMQAKGKTPLFLLLCSICYEIRHTIDLPLRATFFEIRFHDFPFFSRNRDTKALDWKKVPKKGRYVSKILAKIFFFKFKDLPETNLKH